MPEDEIGCRAESRKLVVSDEAVPFVARGGSIFPSQVINSDPGIKTGDDVLVVDKRDRVLTTARVLITPDEMMKVRRNLAAPMAG